MIDVRLHRSNRGRNTTCWLIAMNGWRPLISAHGWRAELSPVVPSLVDIEFDIVVGADGKRNMLKGNVLIHWTSCVHVSILSDGVKVIILGPITDITATKDSEKSEKISRFLGQFDQMSEDIFEEAPNNKQRMGPQDMAQGRVRTWHKAE